MKFFGDIAKVQEQDDGTIKVYGIASTGNIDASGETILPSAIEAALPDYMAWGAVREMHGSSAAGTAIEARVNEVGQFEFGCHIVDPVAVAKVKAGVYKGFSVGGKCRARDPQNKSVITAMDLIEVSLVDRPCNPEAVISMWKADMPQAQETQLAAETQPAAVQAPIKKSLYQVSRFADLLNSLGYLISDAEWEAQSEGDNSPLPEQMRSWLADGASIMQAMAQEEVEELMASLQAQATVSKAAAGASDIAKAGARFSKSTKEVLAKAHALIKQAHDHMSGLGYDADDEDEEKADDGESKDGAEKDKGDAEKAPAADEKSKDDAKAKPGDEKKDDGEKSEKAISGVDITKSGANSDLMNTQSDVIAKAVSDAIEKAIAPVRADLEKANKRVAELEAMPAAPKARLLAVEKAAGVDQTDNVAPVLKHDGTIDEAATAIKKAMAMGGFRLG